MLRVLVGVRELLPLPLVHAKALEVQQSGRWEDWERAVVQWNKRHVFQSVSHSATAFRSGYSNWHLLAELRVRPQDASAV